MSGFTYTAFFEIEDKRLGGKRLFEEARGRLDEMAAADGARITGDPTWQMVGRTLVVECPCVPLEGVDPREHIDEIAVERAVRGDDVELTEMERRIVVGRLARKGVPLRQLARDFHMHMSTIKKLAEAA